MADPGGISGPPSSSAQSSKGEGGDVDRNIGIVMTADTSGYDKAIEGAIGLTLALGNAYYVLEKQAANAIKKTSVLAIGLGVTMKATGAVAIASAASFEDAFRRVGKTIQSKGEFQSKEWKKDFSDAGKAIRQLSTEVPVAINELAQLAEVAGQLGVSAKNVKLYAETAAALGAATSLGSVEGVQGLTRMINVMGLAEEKITNLASSLAYLGNNSGATERDMVEFGDRVSGTAAQLGYTADQVLAIGAAITATGTNVQLGATAFSELIIRMSTAAEEGGTDLQQFSLVAGKTAEEFREMVKEDPTSAFEAIVQGLGRQGDEIGATLQQLGLGGSGATQTFLNLAGSSNKLATALKSSNSAFEEATAITELAEFRFDTLNHKLTLIKANISEMLRSVGTPFIKIFKLKANVILLKVQAITKLISVLSPAISVVGTFAAILLTVGGALGLVIGGLAKILIPLGGMVTMSHSVLGFLGKFRGGAVAAGGMSARFGAILVGLRMNMDVLGVSTSRTGKIMGVFTTKVIALAGVLKTVLITRLKQTAFQFAALFKMLGAMGASKSAKLLLSPFRELGVALEFIGKNGFKAFAKGAGGVDKAIMSMLPGLLLAAAAAAALYFAFNAGKEALHDYRESTITISEQMDRLASSFGSAYEAVHAYNEEIDRAARDDTEFGAANRVMLQRLSGMDPELANAETFQIVYELVAGGDMTLEEATEAFRTIQRLSGQTIDYDVDFEKMNIAEQYAKAVDEFDNQVVSIMNNANKNRDPIEWITGGISNEARDSLQVLLNQGKREAEQGNIAGATAAFSSILMDAEDAYNENKISMTELDDIKSQIQNSRAQALGFDERGRWSKRSTLQSSREQLEQLFTDDVTKNFEPVKEMQEVFESLGFTISGIADLTDEEMRRINAAFGQSSRVSKEFGKVFLEFDNYNVDNIEQMMFRAQRSFVDGSLQAQKFLEDLRLLSNTQVTIGAVTGVERVRDELQRQATDLEIKDDTETEEYAMINTALQEYNQLVMQQRDLRLQLLSTDWLTGETLKTKELNKAVQDLLANTDDINMTTPQGYAEGMQNYNQLLGLRKGVMAEVRGLVEQEIAFNKSIDKARENLDKNIAKSLVKHNKAIEKIEKNRRKAIKEAGEDYRETLEEIYDDHKDVLEDLAESVAAWMSAYERAWSSYSPSSSAMIKNLEVQNKRFDEWIAGLEELRRRGLSEEAIKSLQLESSPEMLDAIRRLLVGDESNLGEINRLIGERNATAQGNVGQFDSAAQESLEDTLEDTKKAYDKQLKEINKTFDERLEELAESYDERLEDMRESTQEQIDDIRERMAELGEATKTGTEILALAAESANERIVAAGGAAVDFIGQTDDRLQELHDSLMGEGGLFNGMIGGFMATAEAAQALRDAVGIGKFFEPDQEKAKAGTYNPTSGQFGNLSGLSGLSGLIESTGVSPFGSTPPPVIPAATGGLVGGNPTLSNPVPTMPSSTTAGTTAAASGQARSYVTNYNVDRVVANDPNALARDLQERERVNRLTGHGGRLV